MKLNKDISIGKEKLTLLAGPCVAEGMDMCLEIATYMKDLCKQLDIQYVFKASFDKANRSSINSYRGLGLTECTKIFDKIKSDLNLPIVTDIHECAQVKDVAKVADILQIPAFLCRQTDLLIAAGETGKIVNIKKGQFMAPEDMKGSLDKVKSTGNNNILLTERGTSLGYHNLVVDMRSLVTMRQYAPVVFDGTHSVQLPGGLGNASGGNREFVEPLTKAAAAVGIDALFLEIHPNPDKALCDGPNSIDFKMAETILKEVKRIGNW